MSPDSLGRLTSNDGEDISKVGVLISAPNFGIFTSNSGFLMSGMRRSIPGLLTSISKDGVEISPLNFGFFISISSEGFEISPENVGRFTSNDGEEISAEGVLISAPNFGNFISSFGPLTFGMLTSISGFLTSISNDGVEMSPDSLGRLTSNDGEDISKVGVLISAPNFGIFTSNSGF